jgi:hypothetical protein
VRLPRFQVVAAAFHQDVDDHAKRRDPVVAPREVDIGVFKLAAIDYRYAARADHLAAVVRPAAKLDKAVQNVSLTSFVFGAANGHEIATARLREGSHDSICSQQFRYSLEGLTNILTPGAAKGHHQRVSVFAAPDRNFSPRACVMAV